MATEKFDKFLAEAEDDSGDEVEFDWELEEDGRLTLSFDEEEFTIDKSDVDDIHAALMKQGDGK